MANLSERLTNIFHEALGLIEESASFSESEHDFFSSARQDGLTVILAGPNLGRIILDLVEDIHKELNQSGATVYSRQEAKTANGQPCRCPRCRGKQNLKTMTDEVRGRLGVTKLTDHPGVAALNAIVADSMPASSAIREAFSKAASIDDFIDRCRQQAAIQCSPVARQAIDQHAFAMWECLHQVKGVLSG